MLTYKKEGVVAHLIKDLQRLLFRYYWLLIQFAMSSITV